MNDYLRRTSLDPRPSIDGTCRPTSGATPPGCLTVVFRGSSQSLGSRPSTLNSRSSAFSLVEVVIAIGVAAFCLVAMLGLFPTGLKSVKNTLDQTAAAGYLDAVALDLRNTQLGSNVSPLYAINLPAPGAVSPNATNFYFNEDGTTSSTSASLATRYAVQLTCSNPSSLVTVAQIQIYWPPTATITNALGVLESVITINRQ